MGKREVLEKIEQKKKVRKESKGRFKVSLYVTRYGRGSETHSHASCLQSEGERSSSSSAMGGGSTDLIHK